MANDISKSIGANAIKNGTTVTSTTFTGKYNIYNKYVKNTPDISTIQAKYDNRFDDPRYYYSAVSGSI